MTLAIVMVIGMIPAIATHVHAAGTITLDDATIGVAYGDQQSGGSSKWTGGGKSVTGEVKGYKTLGVLNRTGYCDLTITNNRENTATLKFNYQFTISTTDDYITINGTQMQGSNLNDSYSVELAAGASITIRQATDGTGTSTLVLTDIQLIENKTVTTTFKTAANGSYTVDGTAITEATELSKSAAEGYVLAATPAEGYQFVAWYNETTGKYISSAASYTLTLDEDAVISPIFVSNSTALFSVGGVKYADLNAADATASAGAKLIVLENNGTLAAGDYTISSGNTLLIPFNSANTVHTSGVDTAVDGLLTDTQGTYTTPTAFRTLTMASGANITVNGALNVGGEHHAGSSADGGGANNSRAGSPTGYVGMINMASGSAITVANTGKLYCWGFIYGSGTVTANGGAAVYENMQVTDFRGGSATTAVYDGRADYKVFPFSQYYVQNIEVPMVLEKDATVYAATTVYMGSNAHSSTVEFIGTNGLFCVSEGTVTKAYDGATDRLNLIVDGTVGINKLSMSVSGMTITSSDYALPINSNINITVKSGSVCNLSQDLALLPGSQVVVEEGATLNVPAGYSIYIYDADQWENAFIWTGSPWIPVAYAPGRATPRANVATDACVDLNGTLNVEGSAFTTAGGADIYSSKGTGVIYMGAAADNDTPYTYQYAQASSSWANIPVTPLKLHNGNGNYTETNDAVATDAYRWNSACGMWAKNPDPCDDHNYEAVVTPPTCTEDGYTAQVCKFCGVEGEHTDIVPAIGHSYTDVVTAPTCTEKGYTTHTCACGDSYVDTYVDTTGHNFVAGEIVAPTCTAQGYTVYTCSACGATENRDYTDKVAHSYNAVVTAPTCTAVGYTTYTCSVCGDSYTGDETPALGHTEVTVAGKAATCTETGLTEGKSCSGSCLPLVIT